ncbi:MAG: thioesterase family protein [Planctomycetia bacterium]|nr:thioesterase family protein [Planctomycetia bacterium]
MKREAAGDREAPRREANRETAAGLRASLKTRRRVEFRDTDAAGIVHFSAFFFWMESAEHELLRSAGLHVFERHPDGSEYSWPRVSVSCDYRSALRFGEEVDINVHVAELGRSSVTYRFVFEHDGRTAAEGRVVAVRCQVRPGGRLEAVAIPADIVARLTTAGPPG